MQNNEPIWFDKKQEPNKDTYQTVKTGSVVTEINLDSKPKYKIMVCTPCHSEVSMHYTQSVLKFQIKYTNKYYNWNKQGLAWTRFLQGAIDAKQ